MNPANRVSSGRRRLVGKNVSDSSSAGPKQNEKSRAMNLATNYLGMILRTPLVPSASPLSDSLDKIKRMEDAGAAALVLHSLFEEHLGPEKDRLYSRWISGVGSVAESLA